MANVYYARSERMSRNMPGKNLNGEKTEGRVIIEVISVNHFL